MNGITNERLMLSSVLKNHFHCHHLCSQNISTSLKILSVVGLAKGDGDDHDDDDDCYVFHHFSSSWDAKNSVLFSFSQTTESHLKSALMFS